METSKQVGRGIRQDSRAREYPHDGVLYKSTPWQTFVTAIVMTTVIAATLGLCALVEAVL